MYRQSIFYQFQLYYHIALARLVSYRTCYIMAIFSLICTGHIPIGMYRSYPCWYVQTISLLVCTGHIITCMYKVQTWGFASIAMVISGQVHTVSCVGHILICKYTDHISIGMCQQYLHH